VALGDEAVDVRDVGEVAVGKAAGVGAAVAAAAVAAAAAADWEGSGGSTTGSNAGF